MAIPKLIHQTMSAGTLPAEVRQNIATLKERNPGWEYRLYSTEDQLSFISKHYDKNVVRLFNRINPLYGAARADLFRYLLIYRLGGVYLDIKSTSARRLETVTRDKEMLLANWSCFTGLLDRDLYPKGEFQQWHVIAAPEHPFLKAAIDLVLENIDNYSVERFGVGKDGVLKTTGPTPYTIAITPLLPFHNHRLYYSEGHAGLRYTIFHNNGHVNMLDNALKKTGSKHYSKLTAPIVL